MSLPISIEDLRGAGQLVRRLPAFLGSPLTLETARARLRQRLDGRHVSFLELARTTVFERRTSPYRALLRAAGCECGDLERLVRQDGLESALITLYRHGVYVTVEEFKGRRPIIRNGVTIAAHPRLFRNPLARSHVTARSSGSRGSGTPVPIDLDFLRERAVNTFLGLEARGGTHWAKAHWQVPGAGAIARLIEFAGFGDPPVRWFSQVDPRTPGLHPRYRWSARLLRWTSVAAGSPLPSPAHVSLTDPLPIARWMSEVLRRGDTPHLFTFASSAVRLCEAARAARMDIRGAEFTVTGEPFTTARLDVIRRAGANAVPRYAIMECGAIGLGCLSPGVADTVHVLHDLHAVVQPGATGEYGPLRPDALLVSSLGATAPFVLINVSMGDHAVVDTGGCGCPLDRLGWTTRLHTIRSHEKLTAGGMTLLDSDMIRILEDVLPRRFGGGPTDYQLVEDEDPHGAPRLVLVVDPRVGPLEGDGVVREFLAAAGAGSGVERVMGTLWRDARIVTVERRPPWTTGSSKVLHVHTIRSEATRERRVSLAAGGDT